MWGHALWSYLPERAKRSLIKADRDWFTGTNIRSESVLNELRIAIEELLLYKFWKPLGEFVSGPRINLKRITEFENLKIEINKERRALKLLDFENTCRMLVVEDFLRAKSIQRNERDWFCQELPDSLKKLRRERNRAEHDSGGQLMRYSIGSFWAEFMGIGQPGVLIRLSKILFQITNKNK